MAGKKTRRTRARAIPAPAKVMRAALAHGRKRAMSVVVARRDVAAAFDARVPGENGLLIAEGDSWFDYPLHDVLEILEDEFNFRVESVAHKGDTVEQMAYDDTQLKKLRRAFEHLRNDGKVPRAILLSGGGNDIAGAEFGFLLNHAQSTLSPLNQRVVDGVIDERLRFAIGSLISAVTTLAQEFFSKVVPVVIHGYGNPVPDGRGFLGGFWFLPGPWLKPGFSEKGYDSLEQCSKIMEDLIKRFNDLQKSIAGMAGFEHVKYVDLRPLLSNSPSAYKQSWANELHPTEAGFTRIAQKFSETISTFPPAGPAVTAIPTFAGMAAAPSGPRRGARGRTRRKQRRRAKRTRRG